jgi:hypothetical protein
LHVEQRTRAKAAHTSAALRCGRGHAGHLNEYATAGDVTFRKTAFTGAVMTRAPGVRTKHRRRSGIEASAECSFGFDGWTMLASFG